MPRYLSQNTLACLTRHGAEALAQRMQDDGPIVQRLERASFRAVGTADSESCHC
ncbi:MAG: hypothetical protein ACYDCG_16540 [Candidatus Acidiferrales bacterium]